MTGVPLLENNRHLNAGSRPELPRFVSYFKLLLFQIGKRLNSAQMIRAAAWYEAITPAGTLAGGAIRSQPAGLMKRPGTHSLHALVP